MTKMPPDGYPALQYLQSVRVRKSECYWIQPYEFAFGCHSACADGLDILGANGRTRLAVDHELNRVFVSKYPRHCHCLSSR